jgi:hypothetical protein
MGEGRGRREGGGREEGEEEHLAWPVDLSSASSSPASSPFLVFFFFMRPGLMPPKADLGEIPSRVRAPSSATTCTMQCIIYLQSLGWCREQGNIIQCCPAD